MEVPLRLLLLAGLLAALLPAAAATFGPQPGDPCQATHIATQVSFLCAEGPTIHCCETVMAAANTKDGFPCLCRVAAEPQLVTAGIFATHLISHYRSCRGLHSGDAHLADACEGPAPPVAGVREMPALSEARHVQPDTSEVHYPYHTSFIATPQPADTKRILMATVCKENHMILAQHLVSSCGETAQHLPSYICCSLVLHTIDSGCLCAVGEEPQIVESILDSVRMWSMYKACGGKGNAPLDPSRCSQPQSPPPPPPRQAPPSPTSTTESLPSSVVDSLSSLRHSLSVAGILFGSVIVALALGATIGAIVVHIIRTKRRSARAAPLAASCAAQCAVPVRNPWQSEENVAAAHLGKLNVANPPQRAAIPISRLPEPSAPTPSAPPERLMNA